MLASIPILTGSKLRHGKTPPALCQMHNAGGIPVSSDLIFSRQGTVHKVALFILRSRENSVHSVEKLTGQHTPYTFPIITEQCNGYSLSGNTSRFSQRLIQKGFFALFPRDIKGSRFINSGSSCYTEPFISLLCGVALGKVGVNWAWNLTCILSYNLFLLLFIPG